ncbi:MAG: molybdate ABC transporter ATP-binding protein ModF [Natronospirillum sp.]
MQFSEIKSGVVSIGQWHLAPGDVWTVLGGNGSGKGVLARLLCGELEPESGNIESLPPRVHWLSLEHQQSLYERELYNDDTDFSDQLDPGTSVRDLLLEVCAPWSDQHDTLVRQLSMPHLLARGYRLLSSGEGRKVMLARAVLDAPDLLILDEPYEGLDVDSVRQLSTAVKSLADAGQWVMLMVNQKQDIPDWTTHLAWLDHGRLALQGPYNELREHPDFQAALRFTQVDELTLPERQSEFQLAQWPANKPLVSLQKGRVAYGDQVQFQGVDWELLPGEHTQISGPNGSGKSTLLSLINGDHPQCYANNLTVFGYRRGRGETIWDIKKHLGYVSGHLHRDYRVPGNVITAVVSGLTDSIGVYSATGQHEAELAYQWLALLGLEARAKDTFRDLSTGEQRLVLIARALIKQPPLLILDEPTQGLDDMNRFLVLAAVERILANGPTTLLFVSHRADESPALIRRNLCFTPDNSGAALFALKQERLD